MFGEEFSNILYGRTISMLPKTLCYLAVFLLAVSVLWQVEWHTDAYNSLLLREYHGRSLRGLNHNGGSLMLILHEARRVGEDTTMVKAPKSISLANRQHVYLQFRLTVIRGDWLSWAWTFGADAAAAATVANQSGGDSAFGRTWGARIWYSMYTSHWY